MLKMFKPTAEQLLLLALYHQEQIGHTLDTVADRLRNTQGRNANESAVITQARKTAKLAPSSSVAGWPAPLIDTLIKGIMEHDHKRGDSDLLDQVVRTLQMPYGRNIMSGDSMRRLRAALLLPSEQAGLNTRLSTREMSCSQCGMGFHDRESVTLFRSTDGSQTLVCHRCSAPQVVPCASCEGTAALSSKAQAAMSRMQCPECSAKKASALKSPPAEEEVALPTFRATPLGDGSTLRRPTFRGVTTSGGAQAFPTATPRSDNPIVRIDGLDPNASILNRSQYALNILRTAILNGSIPPDARADLGGGVVMNGDGLFSDWHGPMTYMATLVPQAGGGTAVMST